MLLVQLSKLTLDVLRNKVYPEYTWHNIFFFFFFWSSAGTLLFNWKGKWWFHGDPLFILHFRYFSFFPITATCLVKLKIRFFFLFLLHLGDVSFVYVLLPLKVLFGYQTWNSLRLPCYLASTRVLFRSSAACRKAANHFVVLQCLSRMHSSSPTSESQAECALHCCLWWSILI